MKNGGIKQQRAKNFHEQINLTSEHLIKTIQD